MAAVHLDAARLLESIPTPALILDPEGRIVWTSRALAELAGRRPEELHGHDYFAALVPEGGRAAARTAFAGALGSGHRTAHLIVGADARPRHLEWHVQPLRDGGDAIRGTIAYGRELDADAARVRRERLADIGAITAKIVQDLGNPLAAVSMQAQLILRRARRGDFQPAAAVEKPVEKILTTLHRLETLVHDFTEFAREQRLQLSSVDVAALLRDLAQEWLAEAGHEKVSISVCVDANAPSIRADPGMLRSAMNNLICNAIEAQPGGGRVVLSARPLRNDRVEISVADEGPGIPAHVNAFRLFETTKEHGTGLGLPVARQFVQAHDGSIEHAPNAPRGTVFFLQLPIAGPEYTELEVAPGRGEYP